VTKWHLRESSDLSVQVLYQVLYKYCTGTLKLTMRRKRVELLLYGVIMARIEQKKETQGCISAVDGIRKHDTGKKERATGMKTRP